MRLAPPRRPRLSLSVFLALAACGRPAPSADLDAVFAVPDAPALGRPAAVAVSLSEKGSPVTGAGAKFVADMTHPGMVPVAAPAVEAAPGRYEASLEWTMAGDWSLLFEATLTDGRRFAKRHPVRVAAK